MTFGLHCCWPAQPIIVWVMIKLRWTSRDLNRARMNRDFERLGYLM